MAQQMQSLALDEAALCRHLLVALYTPTNDPTLATHRQLSRHLIGLWITDNAEAIELFKRIFVSVKIVIYKILQVISPGLSACWFANVLRVGRSRSRNRF